MANIKFSEFTAETAIAAGLFVVGYDGGTNKRILATDLLESYLPLAGGTMTGDTFHGDNVKSRYNSMQIFNDGTDNFLYCLSGNLEFRNFESGKDITFFANYNNSLKEFMRIDGGANRIIVSEDMNFNSGDKLIFNDNLRIYSSNNDSFITELDNTGILYIRAGADLKLQSSGNEDYIICNENSSVELYYDNIKKLETTSTGANITDTLGILGDFTNPGLLKLYAPISANYVGIKGPLDAGTSYDLQLPNTLPNVTNQILESNASGTLSWIATPGGGGGGATELNDLTDCSISANTAALINVPAGGVGMNSFVMGVGAGNSMTTGAQGMTIIGHNAGATLTSTDYGVYIGAFAGRYQNTATTQGNVLIGYEAGQGSSSATSNSYATVAIGHQALKNVTGGDRNVAIGYSALSNNLTGGTTVAIGVECGKGLTTSSNNIFMGYQAAENTNASNSVIIGYQAMDTGAATNMSNSTVVGYQAARSATTQNATAFGANAAYSQTTASNSVTIGASAGYNNTSSGDRTIVGYACARYNTGAGNTAFGTNALQGPAASSGITGAYNTAIGRKSLMDVTTGFFNTAVGNEALADVTTGYFNVAIGNQAGEGYQTGFYNTFVGPNAGNTKTSGNNCTMLGYNAQPSTATVANEITLGDGSISSLRCQVTSITSLSDKRDKTKIEESNYGLNVIDKLKPVTFDWNTRDGAKVGVKDLGFIAQDLQEVDDENLKLVYDINPEKLEASYGRLIPVLVKAIQELKAEIEILKS
tara:strand:+ start:4284 stop:6566 length:2283 start_codon:yes stop_codon:yes gene_type:complete